MACPGSSPTSLSTSLPSYVTIPPCTPGVVATIPLNPFFMAISSRKLMRMFDMAIATVRGTDTDGWLSLRLITNTFSLRLADRFFGNSNGREVLHWIMASAALTRLGEHPGMDCDELHPVLAQTSGKLQRRHVVVHQYHARSGAGCGVGGRYRLRARPDHQHLAWIGDRPRRQEALPCPLRR